MNEHPPRDVLRRLVEGLQEEQVRLLVHVLGCAGCRGLLARELTAWVPGSGQGEREAVRQPGKVLAFDRPFDYSAVAALWDRSYNHTLSIAEIERHEADAAFAELMQHPEGRWEVLIENRRRFCTWSLAARVLVESREASFDDPRRGERLACLALAIAERLSVSEYGERLLADLRCRGWVFRGHARRLASDLDGAEAAFGEAEAHLEGTIDPVERAIFLHHLAVLRKDQRRFDEALSLLREAAVLYDEAGDRLRAARALTSEGSLFLDQGSPEQALAPLGRALELVDPAADPRTALFARHNLALALAELGRFLEAQRLFARCRKEYATTRDATTRSRARWLEGILAAGTGRQEKAEGIFKELIEEYAALGHDDTAATVGLELAQLYARAGRSRELKNLAEEMAPIFLSKRIHREALTALAFLHLAIEQERASVELIRHVADYLRKSRLDPDLPFHPPGG